MTEAVVRQTRLLNTHARYLYEPLIELSERLIASMPPDARLDTVMLVNSGSEANELAWRFATVFSGNSGAIVTEHAYHGVTAAIADLSPEEWPSGYKPPHVATIAPRATRTELGRAVEELGAFGVAATFVDGGFTSDGIVFPGTDEVRTLVDATHEAGGLFVADEVQAGHGRTGEQLWSFVHYGITPDVVTLGKPMGNGYPVAAVITRRDVAERLAGRTSVFSTFGGNPVAACAALAVLEVLEDERLLDNAAGVGAHLLRELRALTSQHAAIVDVRGRGLLVGVELENPTLAERVVDMLRDDGILIGRTGKAGNVLKIRPPLVFAEEHAEVLVAALGRVLSRPVR